MQKRNPYLVNKAFNNFLAASMLTVSASQIGGTVDGILCSRLISEQAMSAVNITRPVSQLFFSMCMLLGAGSSMMAGSALGKRRKDEADSIFTAALSMTVILGAVMSAACLTFLGPLVNLICPEEALQDYTSEFLRVKLYGGVLTMALSLLAMFVTVDGAPQKVSLSIIAGTFAKIAFDYIFIRYLGMGVAGAGWASFLSYIVSLAFLIPHFFRKDTLKLSFKGSCRYIGKSLSTGLPFGIATLLIAVQMLGNNQIAMTYLGENGIITLSICIYLLSLSMIILSGTMKTFQPVASILRGCNDRNGVMIVIRRSYIFMGICMTVFVLPLLICPGFISKIFGLSGAELVESTAAAIPCYVLNIVFQSIVYLLIPIYQIYGNRKMATFISVGQSLAPMFAMWITAAFAPKLVWLSFGLAQIAVVLCVLAFAAMARRKNPDLTPVLLIPKDASMRGFESSVSASMEEVDRLVEEMGAFLQNEGVGAETARRIELCTEEILKNALEYGSRKRRKRRHYFDCRTIISDSEVTVVLSDDGMPFNPVEQKDGEGFGLPIVKGLCSDMKYANLFRQNFTTLTFEK